MRLVGERRDVGQRGRWKANGECQKQAGEFYHGEQGKNRMAVFIPCGYSYFLWLEGLGMRRQQS